MGIDMRQFQQTFFEESLEGLDVMESGLLSLDPDAPDADAINAIFRAAHSIKGGAGTFGFDAISQFTHGVETLLDELRGGRRAADSKWVDLLLQAVDALRLMFDDARDERTIELDAHQAVQQALAAALEAAPVADVQSDAESSPTGWIIGFRPHAELFHGGNDPLHVFRELDALGALQVEPDASRLTELAVLDPTHCYLDWTLTLTAPVSEATVREAFAWIEDDCDLSIQATGAQAERPAADLPQDEPDEGLSGRPSTLPVQAVPSRAERPVQTGGGTIRVSVDKIDALINLVGELVITQSMLDQASRDIDPMQFDRLVSGLDMLARNTRDIQDAVMATRMIAIDSVFKRFPRVVRDVASQLGKQVDLRMDGEGTELDRGVTEKIADPLTHIIRNSIDHGIESPEQRLAAGKPAVGTITLKAAHEGGFIVITVADDGAGLNRQRILNKAKASGLPVSDDMADADVWQLLFAPGFSTAEAVTDLSGRGVGMDVVKRNIVGLGGQVALSSDAGQGTRVEIRLPLTLAILDGMLVGVGDEQYVIPMNVVCESLRPAAGDIKTLTGSAQVLRVREQYIPMVSLRRLFGAATATQASESVFVIAEADGRRVALEVDALLGHQQVVIKNLEEHYRHVFGVSGATILGDGRVALILDTAELSHAFDRSEAA